MQWFRDPQSGRYYALEDDVVVRGVDGRLSFTAAHGAALDRLPAQLVRCVAPRLPLAPETP